MPEDNFFAGLGGNSLLAGRVTAMLRKRFLVDLAGTTMYVHSTVKRLAQQVDSLVESQGSAGKSDAAEAPTAEIDMTYRGYSSTSPLALAWQAAGILIVELSCELLPALVVYLVLGGAYYNYGLRWWLLILMPATFLLDTLLMMVQAIVVKWAVLGRIKPGSYPLWGLQYLRWWFVDLGCDIHTRTPAQKRVLQTSYCTHFFYEHVLQTFLGMGMGMKWHSPGPLPRQRPQPARPAGRDAPHQRLLPRAGREDRRAELHRR